MTKALIVEDSNQIAEIWKTILEKQGFTEIVTLFEGSKVEEIVQEFKPEIVFMDINLPGDLDGIELTSRIQAIDKSIPVLVLTLNDDLLIFKKAFASGAKGYVVKNSSIKEIAAAIKSMERGERYICSLMQKYTEHIA